MSDYVTDPALLAELNGGGSEYVTDPALLAQLNAPDQGKTLGEGSSFYVPGQGVGNWPFSAQPLREAGEAIGKGAAYGTAGAVVTGQNIINAIPYKEVVVPLAGYKAAPKVWQGLKQGAEVVKNFATGQTPPPAPQQMSLLDKAPGVMSRLAPISPAMIMGAPYAMAGMEAANIRENPTAPGYANVPYAQAYRGEAPTQGAAAAANRREAIRSQTYGGLSAKEQQMLDADRQLSYAIRLKAARKVLGQP